MEIIKKLDMKSIFALVVLCLSVSALRVDQEFLGDTPAILDDYIGHRIYPVADEQPKDPHYAAAGEELIRPERYEPGIEHDGEITPKYGACTDKMRKMKPVSTLVVGKTYRLGGMKDCKNGWDSHLFHWKTFAFPGSDGFPTYDKGVYQDRWCDASDYVSVTVTKKEGDRYVFKDTRKGWTLAFENSPKGTISHLSGNFCTAHDNKYCYEHVYLANGPTIHYSGDFHVPTFFLTLHMSDGRSYTMDGKCEDDDTYMDANPSDDYAVAFFE